MSLFQDFSWDDWVWFVSLPLLAPLFLFPKPQWSWIFLSVPLILMIRLVNKKRLLPKTLLDWALLVLMLEVLVTCFIVPDINFSLGKIAGMVLGVFVFYGLVALLRTEKLIKTSFLIFLTGGTVLSIIGVLGLSRHDEPKYIKSLFKILNSLPKVDFNLPGAETGFHPNALAGAMVLVLPLSFLLLLPYIFSRKKDSLIFQSRLWIIPLGMLLLVMSFILLLTQSRSSFAGMFVAGWLMIFAGLSRRKLVAVVVTLVMFAALVSVLFMAGSDEIPYTDLESRNKLVARVTFFWSLAWKTIKEHPVFGIGMNNARLVTGINHTHAHFHNQFLHTAAEMGIPALIAYLALLVGVAWMCIQVWKMSNVPWIKLSVLGLGAGQLAFFMFGFLDAIPLGAKVGLLFWISIGLIVSLYHHVKKMAETTIDKD
jgi:hypothetical protein